MKKIFLSFCRRSIARAKIYLLSPLVFVVMLFGLLISSIGASKSFLPRHQKIEVVSSISKQEKVKPIEVLLLLALPASGKSEARNYLSSLDPKECKEQLGISSTVDLDDFPYVHMMRRISEELEKKGIEHRYYKTSALPLKDPIDWGALIHLLNEDYEDIIEQKIANPISSSLWLFDRLDAARKKVGAKPILAPLSKEIKEELAITLEKEAKDLIEERNKQIAKGHKDKTIVIEFARGGAHGSTMPLPAPYGYEYSLSQLSPKILEKASILYIQVSPEEARLKNENRADPNDPGSILHHYVPLTVMYNDYGCDDIFWMIHQSSNPHTINVTSKGKIYHLPIGMLDNRKKDQTSFARQGASKWNQKSVKQFKNSLKESFLELSRKENS